MCLCVFQTRMLTIFKKPHLKNTKYRLEITLYLNEFECVFKNTLSNSYKRMAGNNVNGIFLFPLTLNEISLQVLYNCGGIFDMFFL